MIELNITIFIQIVNFMIAYVIIRTLLLKPTVAVILQEQAHLDLLEGSIESISKSNKAKEETMTRRWTACRQQFGGHAPEVAQSEQALRTKTVEVTPEVAAFDKKSIEPMADSLADELVERMSHVR